ncbi:hypothetical protein [Enterococcus sp. 5B3_DIV0040]|uniref:hypothetical protein n=1 Tax=Enterococcus sp. 5B3_DIV0040 TaxID=1834182 RepID=UPI0011314D0C|nr:hypothetical protein [Enterococcus sp. 5B3_DIV0040]
MKKYCLTDQYVLFAGEPFYRIQALIDFGDVRKGDYGGFVQHLSNLSQYGDCWIYNSALVGGNAYVHQNAKVREQAWVIGNAEINYEATIRGKAVVTDGAYVSGKAIVQDGALVCEHARVTDEAIVGNGTVLAGSAWVYRWSFLMQKEIYAGQQRISEEDPLTREKNKFYRLHQEKIEFKKSFMWV